MNLELFFFQFLGPVTCQVPTDSYSEPSLPRNLQRNLSVEVLSSRELPSLGCRFNLERLDGRHAHLLRDAVGEILIDGGEDGHYGKEDVSTSEAVRVCDETRTDIVSR